MEENNFGIQVAKGKNFAEAYHNALVTLNDNGKIYPCDAYSNEHVKKVQKEVSLALSIEDVTKEPFISKFLLCGPDALQDYELEFLYGVRDFNVEAYEQGLEPNFWPYTYHQRIEDKNQIDFVIDDLLRDKETRRAVVLIRDNKTDMEVKDPACLQEFFFNIRDNKLNMTAVMRSNDATQASGMNMYAFIKLQKLVTEKLREKALIKMADISYSKKHADELKRLNSYLKIRPGSYTHVANSYHAYGEVLSKEEYEKYLYSKEGITLDQDEYSIPYEDGYIVGEIRQLAKNAKRIKEEKLEALTYPYEGEYGWKEMMRKRICPFLAELAILKCVEYDLFDSKQVKKINAVLEAYNIPFEELEEECKKRDISLAWLYGYSECKLPKTKKLQTSVR